jgi:hypothetical protein
LAQCGTSGQIYYWNGSQMVKFKKIRGVTTTVNSYNSIEYQGKPLFAVGTKIFSINREDQDFPFAVCHEYTASGTIKSIIAKTEDLLVSSDKIEHIGATYATATITTPEFEGKASKVEVMYFKNPAGIAIETKVDNGSWVSRTAVTDTKRKKVFFNGGIGQTNFIQARITLTGDTIIKSIEIE